MESRFSPFRESLISSPSRFLERYPAGIECNSNSPDEILRALRRFVDEPELYARAAGAIGSALEDELNLRVFRNRFAQMIGIDPSRLLGS